MTHRDFDPVFAAALRNELEQFGTPQPRRAAAAFPAGPHRTSSPSFRRQLVIAGATLAVVTRVTFAVPHLTAPAPEPVAASPSPRATLPAVLPERLTTPDVGPSAVGVVHGTTTAVSGRLSKAVRSLRVTITCQGNGFPTIKTSDGFTENTTSVGGMQAELGSVCRPDKPLTTMFGLDAEGGMQRYGRMAYTITPHGRIVWAIAFADGGYGAIGDERVVRAGCIRSCR